MKITFKKITSIFCAIIIVTTILMSTAVSASALKYNGSSSYKSGKYYTALTKVNLTGDQRKDIVNVAKSQIGYHESSSPSKLSGEESGTGNCTEYGRWYGFQNMWCAMFVSWCANTAGVSESIVLKHAYTPTGLTWFKNKGQAYSRQQVVNGKYTPQAGDIIYFKTSRNDAETNHVGIVTSYSSGTVYTVEGNTSKTSSTEGVVVANKSYSITNTKIVYICKPSYKTKPTVTLNKSTLTLVEGKSATLTATATGSKISSWSSSNKSVATVTSAGKVTAVAPGTTTITVKLANGSKATCKVTVKKATVTLNKSALTLVEGKSTTLTATATGSKISSWSSSNKSVATVTSAGKVTAVNKGTATITVKLANGSTATCKVTVTKVSYFPKCSSSQKSIVNALKSIGVDSSMTYRTKIAAANGISNYTGTAAQNTKLLNLLKTGKLIKP